MHKKKKRNPAINNIVRKTDDYSENLTPVNNCGPLVSQFHNPKEANKRPICTVTKYIDGVAVDQFMTKGTPKRKAKSTANMAAIKLRIKEIRKRGGRTIFIKEKKPVSGFTK